MKKLNVTLKRFILQVFFRCTKTAEIINKHLNVKIVQDDRLNEFGSFQNETWVDCQNRKIKCLDDIIEKYNEQDIVICVTSGVNIGAFICKSFNIKPSESTPFLGVPSCSPILFEFKK